MDYKITAATIAEYITWGRENFNPQDVSDFNAWSLATKVKKDSKDQLDWPGWTAAVKAVENKTASVVRDLGDVAAEDDPVLNYFLITETVKSIIDNKVILVLGRKGTGKTALVKYFTEDAQFNYVSKALSLDNYPWKLHAQRIDRNVQEVEAYIASWKYLIAVQLGMIVLNHPNVDEETIEYSNIKNYLEDNYGSVNPSIGDILLPSTYKISKTTLEPQLLGGKIGSVVFDRTNPSAGQEINAITDVLIAAIISLANSCGISNLSLHFDELDRGLTNFDDNRKNMIIGLVSAALAFSRSKLPTSLNIRAVIYLRVDLWDELRFSDKGKLTYGKNTVSLKWNGTSLYDLLENRVLKHNNSKARLSTLMTKAAMRGTQAKWDHIIARTFMRPRDAIQFMNCALAVANKVVPEINNPKVITNRDIIDARSTYSAYFKQELDDEIGAHWEHWQDCLKVFADIGTNTFDVADFIENYDNRKSIGNDVESHDALSILYKYSVIGYEKRSGYGGSSWCFNYLDPVAGWDTKASKLKVHDGLKEVINLKEERVSGSSDKNSSSVDVSDEE